MLKPCPFCGGKAEFTTMLYDEDDTSFFIVRCSICGVNNASVNSPFKTKEEAAEKWNTRKNDEQFVGKLISSQEYYKGYRKAVHDMMTVFVEGLKNV